MKKEIKKKPIKIKTYLYNQRTILLVIDEMNYVINPEKFDRNNMENKN